MVCRNLHRAHHQEVGLMQIPADRVSGMVFGWDPKPLKLNMVMALGLCVKWPWIWVSLHRVSHPMIIFPKPTERKHNRLIMLYAPLVSERLVGPKSKRKPNSKMPTYIHLLHFHTHFHWPNLTPLKPSRCCYDSLHMNKDLMSVVWSLDEIQGPSKLTWSWPLLCV
jgi:hypothetical protein